MSKLSMRICANYEGDIEAWSAEIWDGERMLASACHLASSAAARTAAEYLLQGLVSGFDGLARATSAEVTVALMDLRKACGAAIDAVPADVLAGAFSDAVRGIEVDRIGRQRLAVEAVRH
jgi:hypothetical protein